MASIDMPLEQLRQYKPSLYREADFEQLYGVEGEWTTLSRNSRSYLGTSFLRDQNQAARYH